jgi:hypothetical protein
MRGCEPHHTGRVGPPQRDSSGQAMTEYVIILALLTLIGWLERLPETVAANPLAAAGVALGVGFAAWLMTRL